MGRAPGVAVLLVLAGCAPARPPGVAQQMPAPPAKLLVRGPFGRDFSVALIAGFVLDRTRVADVKAALGPPMREQTVQGIVSADSKRVAPGSPFSVARLSYFYFPKGIGGPASEHPGKTAQLAFLNGQLLGYWVGDSLPGEALPPLDEAVLARLHQCQTTRAEAIALLGPPTAQVLHVLDAHEGTVEVSYVWSGSDAGAPHVRMLRLVFDRSGEMADYTLVTDVGAGAGLPNLTPSGGQPGLPPSCPAGASREHT